MKVDEHKISIGRSQILTRTVSFGQATPKYAVVLIHGIGEHSARYYEWMQLFGKTGAVFYTADLPGHGLSTGIRGHIGSIGEVEQIIDYFMSIIPPSISVFLHGHSMGAVLTLRYLIDRQSNIAGLILTSPWISLLNPPSKFAIFAGRLARRICPTLTLKTGLKQNQLIPNPIDSSQLKFDGHVHGRISISTFYEVWNSLPYIIENRSKIKIPTLIIVGKNDTIVDGMASEWFANNLESKTTFIALDNEFHNLHLSENKSEMVKIFSDWITQKLNKYAH